MKNISMLILCLLLVACAPSAETVQTAIAQTRSAWTVIPSQTAYPTYTAPPTTYITKIVTPTFTPTPRHTPTPSNTPQPPTVTPDIIQSLTANALAEMRSPKKDGAYLIGVDIAPGIWRSEGSGDKCYWAITSRTGELLDNYYGTIGGTVYLSTEHFQIIFEHCGTWIYLAPS